MTSALPMKTVNRALQLQDPVEKELRVANKRLREGVLSKIDVTGESLSSSRLVQRVMQYRE